MPRSSGQYPFNLSVLQSEFHVDQSAQFIDLHGGFVRFPFIGYAPLLSIAHLYQDVLLGL